MKIRYLDSDGNEVGERYETDEQEIVMLSCCEGNLADHPSTPENAVSFEVV